MLEFKPEFIPQSELMSRGWTKSLIERFLPEPDKTKQNPRFRSAAPMKLYSLQRVQDTETSAAFIEAKFRLQRRRAGAKAGAEKKQQQLLELVSQMKIQVPLLDRDTLILEACDNYNRASPISDCLTDATPVSDVVFLNRICVNYLRHCLTDYEDQLRTIASRVGKNAAYVALKTRVLKAIGEKYDWLARECNRQELSIGDFTAQRWSFTPDLLEDE